MPLIADSTRESSLTPSTYSARTRSNTSPNRLSCLYVSAEFDEAAPTSWRSENTTNVAATAAKKPARFIHSPYDTESDRRAGHNRQSVLHNDPRPCNKGSSEVALAKPERWPLNRRPIVPRALRSTNDRS